MFRQDGRRLLGTIFYDIVLPTKIMDLIVLFIDLFLPLVSENRLTMDALLIGKCCDTTTIRSYTLDHMQGFPGTMQGFPGSCWGFRMC